VLTAMAIARAQIMLFSTGRGAPQGFPLAPVLKICGNPHTYQHMSSDMDVNAGEVLEGRALEDVAGEIRTCAVGIMNGRPAKAEVNGQGGILCLYAFTPAF
ncbi:MAG TPA: UxaA family hydrolase, partial [Deltaproteobacteria bacterium]|nr:UxaA family hydrolase [Deltaproteobacteria bacterium]